ncbi:11442_t:CDS:2, partial [Gigaspora rosea]
MGTGERNPEACTTCRRRKRKCYEGIKGEKPCHYCTKSGKNCSYISESTETYSFEAMGNSPSTSTAQSASTTNLVEGKVKNCHGIRIRNNGIPIQ